MLVKTTIIRATTAIVLFLAGGILIEDTDETAAGEKQDEPVEMGDVQEFNVTSENDIEKLIIDMFGETTNTGEKRVEGVRSEEHTSELQSRGHLVCRLLLEKKNTQTKDRNVQ